MIDVHFNVASVGELHTEMRALLNGTGPTGVVAGGQVVDPKPSVEVEKPDTRRPSGRTRDKNKTAETGQSISTGEERTDPETEKQDAADEAADTAKADAEAAAKAAAEAKPVPLTHDDVKKLLGGYVQAYGMEAAQADGIGFIGAPKISEIPDDQAALASAIIGIATAIQKNPKGRELAGDGLTAEKTAELKPIVARAMAVQAAK